MWSTIVWICCFLSAGADNNSKTFYIDNRTGDDANDGRSHGTAWKSFARINKIRLQPGDFVNISGGGTFHQSLRIQGRGTAEHPVQLQFSPGTYEFFADSAIKMPLHISNTNDRPYDAKAVAIFLDHAEHVAIRGEQPTILIRGKMIEVFADKCKNVQVSGLRFDYRRPTVSELTITRVSANYADAEVHEDSDFVVADSILSWVGEGWSHQPGNYWQEFESNTGRLRRMEVDATALRFARIDNRQIRIYFASNPGFTTGNVYQNRDVTRDCAGMFLHESDNILLSNLQIRFMHGMGIVSQYCRNIKIDSLQVKPVEENGRTSAAWADILHFSGCRGHIEIVNSFLSAANDDAINIHGTHLQITDVPALDRVQVRFMHEQTYGFEAFAAGDTVQLVNPLSLLPAGSAIIRTTKRINDKEWLLQMQSPLPPSAKIGHVIENISATPSASIRNNVITSIPTRGILITTRRKVVITGNQFGKIVMNAILVSDDASSWYESGQVKDLLITCNSFRSCGSPVINIYPENKIISPVPVHDNIEITRNAFEVRDENVLSARSTGNLKFMNNKITSTTLNSSDINKLIFLQYCINTKVENNIIAKARPEH